MNKIICALIISYNNAFCINYKKILKKLASYSAMQKKINERFIWISVQTGYLSMKTAKSGYPKKKIQIDLCTN
jgi:hypothetical protein